jgi:hypothetical protein
MPAYILLLILSIFVINAFSGEIGKELVTEITVQSDSDAIIIKDHFDKYKIHTLEYAINLVKQIKNDDKHYASSKIRLKLQSGIYRLKSPIKLTGNEANDLEIIGPNDSSAVISGSQIINGFSLVVDNKILSQLPFIARGKVLFADLHNAEIEKVEKFVQSGYGKSSSPLPIQLIFRGKEMTLARMPNVGYSKIKSNQLIKSNDFMIDGLNLDGINEKTNILASGYFNFDWAFENIPISNINHTNNTITLSNPPPTYGIKSNQRVFLQNSLSFIDQPGEWFADDSRIYFWPPEEIRTDDVEVSVSTKLLEVKNAKNFIISNLSFRNSLGDGLELKDVVDTVLKNSTIENIGNTGVYLSGINSGLRNVEINNIGEGAVVLSGGDRSQLISGGLYVENCDIHHFSTFVKTYKPGILISGVGNRVVKSKIFDSPHSAIIFTGNNHLISGNEISKTNLETYDSGAIYTGRSWSSRGTLIVGNFLHDLKKGADIDVDKNGTMGVYLDDQVSGILVKNNLFVDVDQPVFIGGGRENLVELNTFVRSSPAVCLDGRGLTFQKDFAKWPNGYLFSTLNEVPWKSEIWKSSYPKISSIALDEPGTPKYNVVADNLIIDSLELRIRDNVERFISVKNNWNVKDVIFIKDMENGLRHLPQDFRLDENSRALKSGFKQFFIDENSTGSLFSVNQ